MADWIDRNRQSSSRPRLMRFIRPSGIAAMRRPLFGLHTTRLRSLS